MINDNERLGLFAISLRMHRIFKADEEYNKQLEKLLLPTPELTEAIVRNSIPQKEKKIISKEEIEEWEKLI